MPSRPARGVRFPSPFDTPPSAATQGEERGLRASPATPLRGAWPLRHFTQTRPAAMTPDAGKCGQTRVGGLLRKSSEAVVDNGFVGTGRDLSLRSATTEMDIFDTGGHGGPPLQCHRVFNRIRSGQAPKPGRGPRACPGNVHPDMGQPQGETSFPLAEGPTITPPLRGSHRGRAVCAKADVVGGETRFIAIPNYTPHRIAFGLTPSALRRAFPSGSPTLKGGVILSLALVGNDDQRRNTGGHTGPPLRARDPIDARGIVADRPPGLSEASVPVLIGTILQKDNHGGLSPYTISRVLKRIRSGQAPQACPRPPCLSW